MTVNIKMKEPESELTIESLNEFIKNYGNEFCADCNNESPKWASIQHGVLICTKCAGVHRSIGVQYSFVQSLTLDNWNNETIGTFISKGLCEANNAELEYHVPESYIKPTHKSSRKLRELYIKAKYKDKLFHQSFNSVPLKPVQDIILIDEIQTSCVSPKGSDSTCLSFNSSSSGKSFSLLSSKSLFSSKSIKSCESSKLLEGCVGEIEFQGILMINLKSCCHLKGRKWSIIRGKPSPYVVFELGTFELK